MRENDTEWFIAVILIIAFIVLLSAGVTRSIHRTRVCQAAGYDNYVENMYCITEDGRNSVLYSDLIINGFATEYRGDGGE